MNKLIYYTNFTFYFKCSSLKKASIPQLKTQKDPRS